MQLAAVLRLEDFTGGLTSPTDHLPRDLWCCCLQQIHITISCVSLCLIHLCVPSLWQQWIRALSGHPARHSGFGPFPLHQSRHTQRLLPAYFIDVSVVLQEHLWLYFVLGCHLCQVRKIARFQHSGLFLFQILLPRVQCIVYTLLKVKWCITDVREWISWGNTLSFPQMLLQPPLQPFFMVADFYSLFDGHHLPSKQASSHPADRGTKLSPAFATAPSLSAGCSAEAGLEKPQ